jgi:hypothetical protein
MRIGGVALWGRHLPMIPRPRIATTSYTIYLHNKASL